MLRQMGDDHKPFNPVIIHLLNLNTPYWQSLGNKALLRDSKTLPTDPWSIPQTPNQQFMKEFLSFGGLGMSGVCSRGMLGFP